jgi:hypothetical protein
MESLRKEKQTKILEMKRSLNQIKNAVESHSSKLKQWKTECQNSKTKQILKEKTKNS